MNNKNKKRVQFMVVLVLGSTATAIVVFLLKRSNKKKRIHSNGPSSTVQLSSTTAQEQSGSSDNQIKGLRICCSTIGSIFSSTDNPEEPFQPIASGLPALFKLLGQNDVYLITKVDTKTQERHIMRLLEDTGLLWAGLNPNKVLFCSTDEGRVHIARQLDVHFYIDNNFSVISQLQPHLPKLLYIADDEPLVKSSNVAVSSNLHSFVSKYYSYI